MTGDEFLKLAADLLAKNRAPSEALCRTIVSRSYYGAFHLAREFLAQLGFPRTADHGALAESLKESGEPNVSQAGVLLKSLATARRRADYDLVMPTIVRQFLDADYVKRQVELGTDIGSLLERSSNEVSQAIARKGIAAFRKIKLPS